MTITLWMRLFGATASGWLAEIGLSGPILVTTVVGLAIFLVAVLLSPETKGKVLVADLAVA